MNIIEFDESGRILSVVTYFEARSILEQLYPGRLILSEDRVVSQSCDYVKANELLSRPLSPVAMRGACWKVCQRVRGYGSMNSHTWLMAPKSSCKSNTKGTIG